jgi:hypothetical protein
MPIAPARAFPEYASFKIDRASALAPEPVAEAPLSGINAARLRAYPLITYSSSPDDSRSSRWIDGKATFTIVTSSKIMPCPMHIASKITHSCSFVLWSGGQAIT